MTRVSQMMLVIKIPPAYAGDVRVAGLIPGLGRSLGVGDGSPLQYSRLKNSTDRGAWWVTESQTRLSMQTLRNYSAELPRFILKY